MKIPDELILSVEDIRYIRYTQLSLLTGIDPSNFSAWNNRRKISERSLEHLAERLGISKLDLLQGLDLRRQDTAIARAAQAKAERLIVYLTLQQETA